MVVVVSMATAAEAQPSSVGFRDVRHSCRRKQSTSRQMLHGLLSTPLPILGRIAMRNIKCGLQIENSWPTVLNFVKNSRIFAYFKNL